MSDGQAGGSEEHRELEGMTLVEHLTELRNRLMKSIAAVVVCGAVGFALYPHILEVLIDPYCRTLPPGEECRLFITGPLEGFNARIKVAAYVGIALSSPVILWQIWQFVTPALYERERRYALPFITSAIVLFATGTALGYLTFPKALEFVIAVGGGENIGTIFSPERYLSFLLRVLLGFGLVFEFPVLLVFLQLVGVLPSARLRQARRYAIVIIVVVAAIVTPSQDPWTLLAMSGPMWLFYEIAIIIGRAMKK